MDQNAKQLAVERIKQSTNVLVTVGVNPSVDALAAAIGFSLLLGKLEKHASAVFSGQVPPAIEFLEPSKRFSKDVSSLRDFIIALDKEKADKLRYKVEDNVVKIFITPYRSSITQADLRFSQGDFNVDAVVALGVTNQEDLDNAIKSNGRILHDAAVITMNAGSSVSNLGAINWQDPSASSLSEMLVSISESFGSGLLDPQMATAFLTGIVAATDHFSNNKTSPKVMTMSAQLMAAGANQQLISTNLTPPPAIAVTKPASVPEPPKPDDNQITIDHDNAQADMPAPIAIQPTQSYSAPPAEAPTPPPATPFQFPPTPEPPVPPPAAQVTPPAPIAPPPPPPPPAAAEKKEKTLIQLEQEISNLATTPPTVKTEPKTYELTLPAPVVETPELKPPSLIFKPKPIMDSYPGADGEPTQIGHSHGHGPRDFDNDDDPALGGTFNATSEKAHEESISDLRNKRNKKLLSHPGKPLVDNQNEPPERAIAHVPDLQPLSSPPPELTLPVSPAPPTLTPPLPPIQPPVTAAPPEPPEMLSPAPTVDVPPTFITPPPPQSAPPAQDQQADIDAARSAVEAAFNSQPFDPAHQPIDSLGAQPLTETSAEVTKPSPPQFKVP